MRIRTIKPEFWQHPVFVRTSDSVRLCALATLSMSDDEGYFYADPNVIRGVVWPLDDDSSKARRCFDQLIVMGWMEARNHPTHGLIARVTNFNKHQKIDRANTSKIRPYFDDSNSTIYRRMIVDQSSTEQGTGNRDPGTGKGNIVETSSLVRQAGPCVDSGMPETALQASEKPQPTPAKAKAKRKRLPKPVPPLLPGVSEIIKHLNEKSGRTYRESAETVEFINARMAEPDVNVEDVKLMIDRMCKKWMGTNMEDYLRPSTLFNAEKFEGYYASRLAPISTVEENYKRPKSGMVAPKPHDWSKEQGGEIKIGEMPTINKPEGL